MDDLNANQHGSLSNRQLRKLKLERLKLVLTCAATWGISFLLLTALVGSIALRFVRSPVVLLLALAGCGIVAWFGTVRPMQRRFIKLGRDLRDQEVYFLEGHIRLLMSGGGGRGSSVNYFLNIDDSALKISLKCYIALEEGAWYRVLYAANSGQILAIEAPDEAGNIVEISSSSV